jgi:putative transposase
MKAAVGHVQAKYAFSERRACRLLLVPVSSYRYKPHFGYHRLHVLLGREGEHVNHKRVHRIYREAGLSLRRKERKHCMRVRASLGVYTAANQEWALDFVHDVVASRRSIHVLGHIIAGRGLRRRFVATMGRS